MIAARPADISWIPETQFRNDKSGSSQSTVAHPLYSLPKIRGGGQFRDLHLADT
jgi:hypothetical protein